MTERLRLRPHQRIRCRAEFDRVFDEGRHASNTTLVLIAAPNGRDYSRLGLIVSRKVGNAVVRNRWKRWIREAFRTRQHELPRGYDFIARPRQGAHGEYSAIAHSLARLAASLERDLTKSERSPSKTPPGVSSHSAQSPKPRRSPESRS